MAGTYIFDPKSPQWIGPDEYDEAMAREWATTHPYARVPMGVRHGVVRGFATPEEARIWVEGDES